MLNIDGINLSKDIIKAAHFYSNILIKNIPLNNIYLDIEILKDYDISGRCLPEHNHFYPTEFCVFLRDTDKDDMFHCLAHEMVHIKQFVTGQYNCLYENETLTHYWNGRRYIFQEHEDDYWDVPWEIEAYGREDRLYELWLEYKGKKND